MKRLLAILAFCFPMFCTAQESYITTDTDILLEAGASVKYVTPDIYVKGAYDVYTSTWLITMRLTPHDLDNELTTFSVRITKADSDVLTGSGGTETEKYQNFIELLAVDYLTPLNVSTTFTITKL